MIGIRVAHPTDVLHGHGVALACGLDGQLRAEELHGLFAGDTRVLSTYRFSIAGHGCELLGRQRSGNARATWHFQNEGFRAPSGELEKGSLFVEVQRHVAGALHDDLVVNAYRRVRTRLIIQLDADFADVFEVKERRFPPRLGVRRDAGDRSVVISYERNGFRRGIEVSLRTDTPPLFVGSLIVFDLNLASGDEWTCCIEACPVIDGQRVQFVGDPHADQEDATTTSLLVGAPSLLQLPFDRGRADLEALSVPNEGSAPPFVAAGVPWFLTLFARDTLVTTLMTALIGSEPARGALAAVGALQATERDDWRDAEPGKLPHEVRRGELAYRHEIPHTPYYGAHDAPALYCLALWHTWRWTADRRVLDENLDTARAALRWCDDDGDRDHDGLLEYATRSSRGYYNQSWKDARDAIMHCDGTVAPLPIATVELQGYWYAARLAMAELVDACGEGAEASRLREAAEALRARVNSRFWLPDEGFYAMAVDGEKRPVRTISSNPGQLLWTGLPTRPQAEAVGQRILEPDLFTGWGIRTLSSRHPAYNPMSYQRGSVWPHDTMLTATGLVRYGLTDQAATLVRATLEAACAFQDDRLPELFCGFDRARGGPVPYVEANVPQAWAAAAPVLAAQLFAGLVADAPRGRCFVDPWLPEWLPELELRDVAIGDDSISLRIVRRDGGTVVESTDAARTDIIEGSTDAPLWGRVSS